MFDEQLMSDYSKRLAAPFAGELCGDNPKNSNEYEFAKAEVAKNSGRDYSALKVACEKVLFEQAKELSVFGYLALALSQTEGVGATCEALVAMCTVAHNYWEHYHPQRPVGRQNAIKWLNEEKFTGTLERLVPKADDLVQIELAMQGLDDLKVLCFKNFPEAPPSTKVLQKILQKWVQDLKAAIPVSKPVSETSKAQPVEPISPSATSSTPVSDSGTSSELTSKSDANKLLQKVAHFYLRTEPQSVSGYKLMRTLKWQEISAEPKSEGGKTLLAGPNAARVKFFESLVQAAQWDGILEKCEAAFTEPGFLYWLDLQYFACRALRGKAGAYSACATVIEQELLALIERVPGLVALQFKEGAPFASVETQEWLTRLQQNSGAGAPVAKATSSAITAQSLQADLEQAQQLLADNKFEDAIALLQSGLDYGTVRERAERKLAIAKLCSVQKHGHVAERILEELCAMVGSTSLDQWAPEFSLEIFSLRSKNLVALIRTNEVTDKIIAQKNLDSCLAKLSQISPLHAIRIK